MRYFLRLLLGRRRFDVEVTVRVTGDEKWPMIVRNIPERSLDSFVDAAVEKGRSVRILKVY